MYLLTNRLCLFLFQTHVIWEYSDKLIDKLAKEKTLEKILRTP